MKIFHDYVNQKKGEAWSKKRYISDMSLDFKCMSLAAFPTIISNASLNGSPELIDKSTFM